MKKCLGLLLALCMLLSMVPVAAFAADDLTVVTLALFHSSYTEDRLWAESNELQMLRDQYGIDLQATYYDADQFAMMMAGNEKPDIITCNENYITTVLENNMAVDLGEYVDKYPNLNADLYKASNDLSKLLMGGDEHKLYFLTPSIGPEDLNSNDDTSWGIRVRWDLYKQLGCPEIKTADDFIQVMKDMLALYPETENGEKVYGIGTWNAYSRWYQAGCMLVDGGALNPWIWGGTMYMTSWQDTTLYNGYTDEAHSAYWTAMKFWNKCYREGLLDTESFIMTGPELKAKVAAGRYVAAVPYEGRDLYNERRKDDPDTLTGIIAVPSTAAFVFADKMAVIGNSPSDNIFVNAKSEHIEEAVKVLDFFRDEEIIRIHLNGVKGVDWDVTEDGTPYLTDKAYADIQTYGENSPEYAAATHISGYVTEFTPFMTTGVLSDGYPAKLTQTFESRAKVLTPLQKDFAAYYGVSCPSEAYMKLVNSGEAVSLRGDYGQMVAAGISEVPSDIKRIMDECSTICQNAMPDLVMANSDEEFEAARQAVMEELEAADEQTAWAWCEENFNAVKAEMQPIFEEAQAAFLAK